MIKDGKVRVGQTQSEFSDAPSETVVDGLPMTVKEAREYQKQGSQPPPNKKAPKQRAR